MRSIRVSACYGSIDMTTTPSFATIDWANTSLGPVSSWPKSLVGYVQMIMAMPSPAIIFWGPEQTQIYNAGYAVIMGPRHPRYFAAPYRECWPETYSVIYPWMQAVLEGGTKSVEDAEFTLTRHGFNEEATFTFTFSPLRDDTGAIAGIFQPVIETTRSVLQRRRSETLRALIPRADSLRGVTDAAHAALAANPRCIPFSLTYLASGDDLELAARTGIEDDSSVTGFDAIARTVFTSGESQLIDNVTAVLGWAQHGAWPEPTELAYAVPIRRSQADVVHGVAIFGASPRLVFDDSYRHFFDAIAHELGANVAVQVASQSLAEALLREQADQEHLRRVIESSRVGTWELDVATKQVRADVRLLELVGLDAQTSNDLSGVLGGIHPDDRDSVAAALTRALEGHNGGQYVAEFRTVGTGDGRIRWLEGRGQVSFDEHGTPVRMLGVGTEITERKEAEAERASLLETTEAARAEAERANRAKDEFLAILGHELRNPLSPIMTALHLMGITGDETHMRERSVIERQARHLLRLVDDLLDVSRITRGMVKLESERVEIADVIAGALEMVSPILEQRRHKVVVDVAREHVLDADVPRLTQVFSNLFTNAAKYTPPGGTITVVAARAGDCIEVRVRDTGMGITEEMLPYVFDMFTQGRQALDRSQGGLGLGLTIVRSLVTLHRGTVEVRSEGPQKGSEFVIMLPRANATTTATSGATPDPTEPVKDNGRARVLIVDDNEDAALLLGEALEKLGYGVRVTHDGRSALDLVEEFAPTIALLDIGLPEMDGYEVSRRLRERYSSERLRLVAITGYGQASDRERSTSAGFDEHLVKPVSVAQIGAVLTRLMAN